MFYAALWFYAAIGNRLLAKDSDAVVVRGISRSFRPGSLLYGGATLTALASPLLSVILFAAIAAFYVVESSVFGRAG